MTRSRMISRSLSSADLSTKSHEPTSKIAGGGKRIAEPTQIRPVDPPRGARRRSAPLSGEDSPAVARMAGVRPIASFDCVRVSAVDLPPVVGLRGGDASSTSSGRWGRVRMTSRPFAGSWGRRGVRVGVSGGEQLRRRSRGGLVVVNEIAGNYEETFGDIDTQLLNYFTYKAVRTVLHQLYEMNPPNYMWFYNFVATSDMSNGRIFLKKLVKEKQDLAERVMVTRLHLYAKWIKKCDHAKMYENISKENLDLMRERLIETIIWPSEDTNTETIG